MGKNKVRKPVCGPDGSEEPAGLQRGKGIEEWTQDRRRRRGGHRGWEAQAGVERGFPSGAVRPTHGQIDVWASKQSAFLGGSFSC